MGFGPLVHWPSPATPAGCNPTGQDLGRSNRPRPASASPSPRSHWRLDRRRRRLAALANSGGFRRRHLGRNARLSTPYQLHQVESSAASSPRRSGWSLPSRSAVSGHPRCGASPSWGLLRCLCLTGARRLKRQGVMLLVWAWWRLPQAASGWPRRPCPAMPSRRAPGRLVSFSFSSPPSTPLTGHGLW
jgi:hypothetical protein